MMHLQELEGQDIVNKTDPIYVNAHSTNHPASILRAQIRKKIKKDKKGKQF
jgi:hypothetical protein